MTSYHDKLLDPRWQRRRLQILLRDDFTCQECFDNKKTVHVHHKIYYKDRDPWDYKDEDLITLCNICHKKVKERNFIPYGNYLGLTKEQFDARVDLLHQQARELKQNATA